MTTTILAAIALSGVLAPAAKPEFQAHTDYASALKRAASEGKPMAVLIGTGNPFAKVLNDAAMTDETAKLLRDKFVCVAVDTGTSKGAELASQFQLTDGLVISSTGGTYQALRQPGAVSAGDLANHLSTYASAPNTPNTTVTVGAPEVTTGAPHTAYPAPLYRGSCSGGSCSGVIQSGYVPTVGGCASGRCPTVIQGGYVLPTVGGCANGRCPTTR
ncbi:thioredoxin family protein [Gemmata sp. JC717]|uniref:thioredoxin family protein n=1 Tax=Gemmata algarum TaxID=2975278 RepID=UPI0021BB909A|nr:thioredoxin family protein [Gemmata algarum]MDY3551275.1 thioredoxin family protein [Gemmata algarum]